MKNTPDIRNMIKKDFIILHRWKDIFAIFMMIVFFLLLPLMFNDLLKTWLQMATEGHRGIIVIFILTGLVFLLLLITAVVFIWRRIEIYWLLKEARDKKFEIIICCYLRVIDKYTFEKGYTENFDGITPHGVAKYEPKFFDYYLDN